MAETGFDPEDHQYMYHAAGKIKVKAQIEREKHVKERLIK